jgi:hypothetical protein
MSKRIKRIRRKTERERERKKKTERKGMAGGVNVNTTPKAARHAIQRVNGKERERERGGYIKV